MRHSMHSSTLQIDWISDFSDFPLFSPLIGDQTKAENITGDLNESGNQRRSKRSVTSLRYLSDCEEESNLVGTKKIKLSG